MLPIFCVHQSGRQNLNLIVRKTVNMPNQFEPLKYYLADTKYGQASSPCIDCVFDLKSDNMIDLTAWGGPSRPSWPQILN